MRSILAIWPTTNYAMASFSEREDATESLARVFMGLSHPVQLVSQAREVIESSDWPKPPRMERRWVVVVEAEDATALDWRTRTLKDALEGVGLRCAQDYSGLPVAPAADARYSPVWALCGEAPASEYSATLVLRRWPREVAPGWLGHALAGDLPVDVGIHIQPQDAERTARFLTRQQSWQSDQHTAKPDAANELGRSDAERVRKKLIARTDRPVKVAIAMTVRAPDRDALRGRVETLKHEIGLTLGDVRLATFEQDRGLRATLPTGRCELLGAWRTLDCASVASTWPFQPATVRHPNGVDIGVTRKGSMLVKLDPFDPSLEGFSGVIVGKKRMGKSYLMKILARGLAARGVEVTIIEQRNPPEYAVLSHLPNIEVVNIEQVAADEQDADRQTAERVAFLRRVTGELWDRARRDPKPRMLVVDEAWMLLRHAHSAAWIETVARTGGHFGLALWILTQQVRELLEAGRAALDNAEVRVFLKQHDKDLDDICDAVGLKTRSGQSHPAKVFLRSAARGQVLLGVGDLWIDVDVARVPEHYEISTDPRDVWAQEVRHGVGNLAGHSAGAAGVPVGPTPGAAAVDVQHRAAAPAAAE